MDNLQEHGSWNEHKGKLIEMFSALNENDLNYEEGKSEEMFNHVQNKLGKTREELAAIIATLY